MDSVPRVNSLYMKMNRPLRIVKTEDRGRIAVAAEDLQKGTVVLVNRALGLSVSKPGTATICDRCSKGSPDVLGFRCEQCEAVFYCSAECKSEAQLSHATECRILKEVESNTTISSYEFQMMKLAVRLLNVKCNEKKNIPMFLDGMIYSDAMDLQSHLEDFPEEKVELFRGVVDHLFSLKTREDDILNADKEEILSLLYKAECNVYGLWGLEGDGGIGLYPLASYFNHSCSPNLVRFESGGLLSYRAACDIPKGTELNITYTDIAVHRAERQQVLQDFFFFTCGCDRCNAEKDDETTFKMSSSCPLPGCSGFFPKWI